ncbi:MULTISPECIES: IS1595 family transposase [unclassified Neisseria]|uniref:IS1595 family transposase n=1 Tax=unclassified Neisseria TaxID=2623750 RepID=UPI00107161D0|nr:MULTISPECIES: IS1595 family transposase [unclassified Neisseria]MBF0804716.1 IS1595 family transposase [Neisseria sp. 19428wB4_WF04]TFU40266.1 IS1595 family transposase [Neisseria sp. WF04]
MQITNCNLSKRVQKKLLEFFVLQVTTRFAADILSIQSSSAILHRKIRQVISRYLTPAADEIFNAPAGLDESCFGGHRKGKCGRGAAGKAAVFGILKRHNQVDTVVTGNVEFETLVPVIKKKTMPDSIVYTDGLSSCGKPDVSGFTHHRINHSKAFADCQNHINGMENFWNQAQRVLHKYNGIDRKSFPLFLKECEFRFNFGTPS